MFTGIIESIGKVVSLENEGTNLKIGIESDIAPEISIDQSIAHNGVCLTVAECSSTDYTVVAVEETLLKSNLGNLKLGDGVNLERAMKLGDRLDGHIVQGHVDLKAVCSKKEYKDGSWLFSFEYPANAGHITVEKGSVTVNGVSLTVFDTSPSGFTVTIIPYTYEHTTFKDLDAGSEVNIEFDILGKYIEKLYAQRS
ncbi:MAG: riboflavin synthase [Flavobacteriaceae bacterium]|nr:riboflavin synthase [Flavobacteriaceae bacterium]